ncbi:MAG: NifB/NifX family molybdenum-iron cluster-binding protein [Desulfobacterales bacterium]|nr:NifB/NifX family molybdenum-iron cluster-binding protein [Desulfobacterales bacterium]
MKIAISSSGNSLDSALDPRFGRCAYFLIVDPANMDVEIFDNQSAAQGSGAGIQAAQLLAGQNVDVIITGHVGPNAVQTLTTAGIDIFTEQQGTIKEVIARFNSGSLKPTSQATVGSHFGMGTVSSAGGRMGAGKASGGYGGRGMGRSGTSGMRQGTGRGQGRGGGMRRN